MTTHQGNILVTGAGGFIGSHLVTYLKRQGYRVRGVDLKYPDFSSHDADDFLLLDLRSQEACLEATRDIDEVYALASDTGGSGFLPLYKPHATYNNLLINLYTIEAARTRRVKRYLYASSLSNAVDLPYIASPLFPANTSVPPFFKRQMIALEQQLEERLSLHYGAEYAIDTRVVRLPNVFGPRAAWEGGKERAPAALCRKIAQAKFTQASEIEIWGTGEQQRTFCYIDDCIPALYQAMLSTYPISAIHGLYSSLTISQLTDMLIRIAGIQVSKQYVSAPNGPEWNVSQDTNIPQVIGTEPTTSLEQALTTTYTWIEERVRMNLGNSQNP